MRKSKPSMRIFTQNKNFNKMRYSKQTPFSNLNTVVEIYLKLNEIAHTTINANQAMNQFIKINEANCALALYRNLKDNKSANIS